MNFRILDRALKALVLSFLPFLLIVSCENEEPLSIPDSYLKLLSRYEGGFEFMNASKSSDGTTVFFSSGGSVKIPSADFPVVDCTFKDPDEVALDESGREWMIAGEATGILNSVSAEPEECHPVYAYFNDKIFCLFISNGEKLIFYADVDDPLLSFVFRKQFNPDLPDDILMSVEGRSVKGVTVKTSQTLELVPTFVVEADYVTVAGIRQLSSVSSQDFSESVVYEVHKYNGDVVEYTVSFDFHKRLPYVRIETRDRVAISSRSTYVPCTVEFDDFDKVYGNTMKIESEASVRGRGNTTWSNFPSKRPYRLKLDDSRPVFGMNKDKDWLLLAEYSDKTLLRNRTAMEISRICGLDWTPEMRSVNLYLNGVYKGVYTLCEAMEVADDKVDLELAGAGDNSGEALTGGYYLEIDTSRDRPVHFDTQVGIPVMFKDPENPTKAQEQYIKDYFRDFETALYATDFDDPANGYAKYIDVESFINYYIIAELSKNIDGNLAKSCYMSKPRGGKLRFCHTWDYDLAFGNCNYIKTSYQGASNGPEGWFACKYIIGDYYTRGSSPGWFGRLLQDPVYLAAFRARWKELYPRLKEIPAYIDSCVESLLGAQEDNFRVHQILGVQVWPNRFVYKTYAEEVHYLKSYYSERLEWMNKAIDEL